VARNKVLPQTSRVGLVSGSKKSIQVEAEHTVGAVEEGNDFNVMLNVHVNTRQRMRFDIKAMFELVVSLESLTVTAATPAGGMSSTECFPCGESWAMKDCVAFPTEKWRSCIGPFRVSRPPSAFAPATSLDSLSSASLTTSETSVWHARASISWHVRIEVQLHAVPGSGELAKPEHFEVVVPVIVVPKASEANLIPLEESFEPKMQLLDKQVPGLVQPTLNVFRIESTDFFGVDSLYSISAGLLTCVSSQQHSSPLLRLWKDETRCFDCEQAQLYQ
jgi:hypothetical protein